MTSRELELRLSNIEKAISDLARKQSERDNRNESNINDTNNSMNSMQSSLESNIIDIENALCELSITQ